MSEFFWGWKRKVGIVTLVMVCSFTAGWVRSFVMPTGIVFSRSETAKDRLLFRKSDLVWERFRADFPLKVSPTSIFIVGPFLTGNDSDTIGLSDKSFIWNWQHYGFGISIGESRKGLLGNYQCTIWAVPYWLIVLPLTMISLWLLLSKPCKLTQKKIVGPATDEGVAAL